MSPRICGLLPVSRTSGSMAVCVTSLASYRDVLKSRHLWMWDRKIFAGLCSGEEGEGEEVGEGSGEEKGLLTRRTLCSTLTHFRTQT